jgi:ribosomal protein L29
MKSKDKKELFTKNIKELGSLIIEAKDALTGLKLEKVQNKLKNTSQLTRKRKEIAQMMTVLRIKQLAEVKPSKKK